MVEVEMAQGVREFPKYDPGLGCVASEFSVGPSFITFCSQSRLRIGFKAVFSTGQISFNGSGNDSLSIPKKNKK